MQNLKTTAASVNERSLFAKQPNYCQEKYRYYQSTSYMPNANLL